MADRKRWMRSIPKADLFRFGAADDLREGVEVVTHDRKRDGAVKGVAVARGGFEEKFPITPAKIPQDTLPQHGAGQRYVVR